jgi:hypothetical protein
VDNGVPAGILAENGHFSHCLGPLGLTKRVNSLRVLGDKVDDVRKTHQDVMGAKALTVYSTAKLVRANGKVVLFFWL